MESEIKGIRPKEISSFDLGERESKHGEKIRKEEEEEEEEEGEEEEDNRYGNYGCMETMGVWNLSMDIWFRTLYLVYGLGLGTPKLISCMVELRRALRLLDTCFEKGPVTSRTQKIPCFRSYAIVEF